MSEPMLRNDALILFIRTANCESGRQETCEGRCEEAGAPDSGGAMLVELHR